MRVGGALAARVAAAFDGAHQPVFERILRPLQEALDHRVDDLRPQQAVAEGDAIKAFLVTRPAAAAGARMGGDLAVAIHDRDLAIGMLGVVGGEDLHHARRQVALRQELDAQRIVGAVGESLRLAHADVGRHALAAAADGQREGGDAEAETAGAGATPDQGIGH